MKLILLPAALLLSLPVFGCGAQGPRLYCGAGIRAPVEELVGEFNRRHGVHIVCDYAGSEVLFSRIKLTGKGDLYMPGDVHYVELADQAGLIASRKTVCYFVPVILVQAENPKGIHRLRDLARGGLRIGLGDPKACAIGRKSLKILEKNNIPTEKLNVALWSPTVTELANHIKAGSLDAVIVWDAVAAQIGDAGQIVRIPPEQNVISTVVVGVLKSSTDPELAEQFVRFVTSRRGKEVFRKYHYAVTLPQ